MVQGALFTFCLWIYTTRTWFPHGLENLEKWENIFQSGKKSGDFEKTGKVREFYSKYWKNVQILPQIIGKVIEF